MKKTKEEILIKIFRPDAQDCQTPRQDLQLAITLSPELEMIEEAMEEYEKQENQTSEQISVERLVRRFYFDDTNIAGYWAIRDREDVDGTIWIDCKEEFIPIIIDGLNNGVKSA